MKKCASALLMLLLETTLGACGDASTPSHPEGNIEIQMETESQQYTLADGTTPALDFRYQKPVVTIPGREKAAQAINEDSNLLNQIFIEGNMEGSGMGGRDTFIQMAQEDFNMRQENGFEGEFLGYSLYREVTPEKQGANVLSLRYEDYYYTGGAHGGANRTGVNYDTQTGERLTLQTIAVDEAGLKQFCIDKILELAQGDDYKYEGNSMFFEDYVENVPSIMTDGLWYFSNEGLVFIANQYVLAPYAAGIIEFTIPYTDLEGVVKAEYLQE